MSCIATDQNECKEDGKLGRVLYLDPRFKNLDKMRVRIWLFVIAAIPSLCATAQDTRVEETVTRNKIESHIYFLASDALKGRDTGSPELDIAAEYIATRFREYGIAPLNGSYYQEVPFKRVVPPTQGVITTGDLTMAVGDDVLMLDGGNGDWSRELVFVGYGTEKDFKKAKVEGKIVVAICGAEGEQNPRVFTRLAAEKKKLVTQYGGLGLIELYNSTMIPWSLLVRYLHGERIALDKGEESMLHLWVNDSNNERVAQFDQKNATVDIKVEGMVNESFTSKNVVGVLPGTDSDLKEEYMMYSAHYDHVGVGAPNDDGDSIYNGSRDNAVGTVTVLAMAENLGKYPPKRSSLFVLFTGEEKGLLGSQYFADHPAIPLNQIIYCFNSDNGGYNDTSLATIIGLSRTTADQEIRQACEAYGLKAIDDPAPEQGLFDRSDNVNFAKKGVPAPTFGMGFTAFDEEIGKYYHQVTDNPETLDYEYLEKFFRAYVYSGRLIADRDTRPFWVEGDKYYEAGKLLYQQE